MNRKRALVAVMVLALVTAGAGLAQARMMGWGWDDRGAGRGGYGCDGPGYGRGGYDCQGPRGSGEGPRGGYSSRSGDVDVTREEAESMISFRLRRMNPNLKVGKITENEAGFEVQIVTQKGNEIVETLQVEKDTGRTYRLAP